MLTTRSLWEGRVLVGWTDQPTCLPLLTHLALELGHGNLGPLHHHCPICGSIEHGRPSLELPLEVSLSRAPGVTVGALSTAGPVGVDIEADPPPGWVLREAVGKAAGVGLALDVLPDPVWSADLAVPGYCGAVAVVTDADRSAAEVALRTARPRKAR